MSAEDAAGLGAKVQLLRRLRGERKDGFVLKKVNGVASRVGLAVEGYVLQCHLPLTTEPPSVLE